MASYNWLKATLFQYTEGTYEDITLNESSNKLQPLYEDILARIDVLKSEMKLIDKDIKDMKDGKKTKKHLLKELKKCRIEISNKLQKKTDEDEDLKARYNVIQKRINKINNIKSCKKVITDLETEKEQLQEQVNHVIQLRNTISNEMTQIEQKTSKCFIETNLTQKDQNRTKEQAKKDFISAANWSWNTEDVLKLMEEGLIPTNLVKDILNDASWTNDIWCWFNDKVSLKHLIASKNIQILSYNNKCIALNPEKSIDENKDRVKKLFEQTNLNLQKDNAKLCIHIHGTGAYVHDFDITPDSDVALTLSNIPSGLVAINSGIKERVNIGKDIVSAVIKEFDNHRQNKEQNQEAHENEDMITKKNKIIISSASFGNLFAALLSKELTQQNIKIDVLNMEQFAWSVFHIFQSIDDISDALKNDDCVKNIKEIWIPDLSPGIHYKSLAQEIRQSLQDFENNNGARFKVKKIAYYTCDRQFYQGEWNGNNRSGKGSLFDRDGQLIYEGEWKDDKENGEGESRIIGDSYLKIKRGDFKDGYFVEGTIIEKNFSSKTMMVQKGTVGSSGGRLWLGKRMDFKIDPTTNSTVITTYNIKNGDVKEKNKYDEECIKRTIQAKTLKPDEIFTLDEFNEYKQMYEDFLKECGESENIENNKNNIIKNVNNNKFVQKKQESEDKKINIINEINNIEENEDKEQEGEDKEYPIGTDNNKQIKYDQSEINLDQYNWQNNIKI